MGLWGFLSRLRIFSSKPARIFCATLEIFNKWISSLAGWGSSLESELVFRAIEYNAYLATFNGI